MQNVKTEDLKTNSHAELLDILGDKLYCDDPEYLALMSEDIWTQGEMAGFVLKPANLNELTQSVAAAHSLGIALNPRGAGMSYTKAHTPDRSGIGIIDFSKLDRIVEINLDDMYVTVEAGCTWDNLYLALKENRVRTPFWGPMSGLKSTIGGGLSQNNAFFGAGLYGTTSDSVLCLTMVLGDGSVVKTGSAGIEGGRPFFRNYGPDITGLFCGDSGALGHKAEITLRLIPMPEHEECVSFEYDTSAECMAAMQELMRQNLACELFAFDPNLQKIRLQRASFISDVKTLKKVVTGQGSIVKGIKAGAKVAMAGRNFVDDEKHGLHFVVEGRSAAGVKDDVNLLRKIAEAHHGNEIENSIPKILRANPFNPLNSILGPCGERWVPVHGLVSNSDAPALLKDIEEMIDNRREEIERHEIVTSYLLTTVATTGFIIEPVFFWPEEIYPLHEQTIEESFLQKVIRFPPNPDATAVVADLRQAVIDLTQKYHGTHLQIGRTYPYREKRDAASWALIERIKKAVDADGLVNPGSLGLLDIG